MKLNIKSKISIIKNKIHKNSLMSKLDFSYFKKNSKFIITQSCSLFLVGIIALITILIGSNGSTAIDILHDNTESTPKQNSSHIVTLLKNNESIAPSALKVNSELLEKIKEEEAEAERRRKEEEAAKKKKENEAKGIYTAPPQTPSEGFVQYDIPLAYEWQVYTYNLCQKYGVSYEVMLGLMNAESSFDPNASSGVAYGLCQIHECHEAYAQSIGIDNFKAPEGNILLSVKFLSGYVKSYNGDYHKALICYNYGEGGAHEYCFSQGIYQTYYSQKVLNFANNLTRV